MSPIKITTFARSKRPKEDEDNEDVPVARRWTCWSAPLCRGEEKQKEEDAFHSEKFMLMVTKEDDIVVCCLV